MNDRKRPVFERIFWICVFIVSIFFCGKSIYEAWHKWKSNPVIINFNQNPTFIWEIPFPAVTICPEIKTIKSIFNYTQFYHELLNMNNYDMSQDEYVKKL